MRSDPQTMINAQAVDGDHAAWSALSRYSWPSSLNDEEMCHSVASRGRLHSKTM